MMPEYQGPIFRCASISRLYPCQWVGQSVLVSKLGALIHVILNSVNLSCHHVIVSSCHHVDISMYQHVIMLYSHQLDMSSGHHVIMSLSLFILSSRHRDNLSSCPLFHLVSLSICQFVNLIACEFLSFSACASWSLRVCFVVIYFLVWNIIMLGKKCIQDFSMWRRKWQFSVQLRNCPNNSVWIKENVFFVK